MVAHRSSVRLPLKLKCEKRDAGVAAGMPTLPGPNCALGSSLIPVHVPAMSDFNIDYVARLARIELSPEEKSKLGPQLEAILGYVAKLKEVDVEGVEPTAHAFPLVNVTRPDEVTESLSTEEALRNAPAKAGGLFVVPKIVE